MGLWWICLQCLRQKDSEVRTSFPVTRTFSRATKIELLSVRDKAQKLTHGAGMTRAQHELASGQDQERGQKEEQSR